MDKTAQEEQVSWIFYIDCNDEFPVNSAQVTKSKQQKRIHYRLSRYMQTQHIITPPLAFFSRLMQDIFLQFYLEW